MNPSRRPPAGNDTGIGARLINTESIIRPYLIVFTASACGLILEIVAARILAPEIGISLYTWTSIIGVVLAGISIGNYLGGRIADRFPSPKTLGFILLAGGIASLAVLPLVSVVSSAFESVAIIPRIIFLTATLFFIPSAILGMVTPVVVRLSLKDLTHAGNVVGKIYAISTAGAIFGVFITGFVLVQYLGTRQTILVVALVLMGMSVVFGSLWRIMAQSLPGFGLFAALLVFSSVGGALNSNCLRESNYFCIQVTNGVVDGRYPVRILHLDRLAHSTVYLEDPTLLMTGYENVIADLAGLLARETPDLKAVFIGGGGYTLPRYVEEVYPQSGIEVIEIDPEVTQVAFEYLGLRPDTRIVSYNEDARMAVPKLDSGRYNLVVGDAFNDLSVPYHLTTREFNDQIRALLTENGVYAINVVDKLHTGNFVRFFVHTLQETFPYVYLLREDADWKDDAWKTHAVAASSRPLSLAEVKEASIQAGRGEPVTSFMPPAVFEAWQSSRHSVLLTDDYAPLDNIMAAVYLSRDRLERALSRYNEGVRLGALGQADEAIAEYSKAIGLEPTLDQAYVNRGGVFNHLGQYQNAIRDYTEALRLVPEYAVAYYNRGIAHIGLAQYTEALADLDQAIGLDPSYGPAYSNRAIAHFRLGQFRPALQDLDQVIGLNPESAQTYVNRGLVHSSLGEAAKAQDDFDRAVELGVDPEELKTAIEAQTIPAQR
jgi:tetratricopeptide (TPR) repeat protein/MFS family permease